MTVTYRAVAFHRDTGNLQVVFYSEAIPQGIPFSITIPRTSGMYPAGKYLDDLIRSNIPHDLFAAAARGEFPAVAAAPPTQPPMLNDVGTDFVTPAQAAIFMRRSLVRLNGIPIPVEIE